MEAASRASPNSDSQPSFDADRPLFTIGQASFLSGTPVKNINNWLERGVLTIGQPPPYRKHGWRFSLADAIQLRIASDLATRIGVDLPTAATVARKALEVAHRAGIPADGTAHASGAGGNASLLSVLVAYDADGAPVGAAYAVRGPGIVVPPVFRDLRTGAVADGDAALRRAHVVVPVSAVVEDLIDRVARMIEALEAELAKPEAETAFAAEPAAAVPEAVPVAS